ncbi:MAG: xanthine dehydrogenase family protein molybdopterin-binding subunit [Tabrizicola sp.]|uniref:xanthine dehydrogenase family protein molybdopterin-binding subunit n=1 Tax=Tabrizicola sp. TaxID=2005166 RepID=UPI0027352143|nr:xanthine dehydrogenase family protein molybdopterin-binding subunit [Tabrizicola sp.]MDP3264116.1 xanthine dehydrogenase family protein molybdopterin-binding subunit [Tabrizicola sp.]MDP3648745.1 xanthine dehydrogenase family protein molybdopterin-binding subunit [Paracoccaceae bacterium]MDZ4067427.1 xanthine dehydrogenase family protein molybdopterin-binding subunit [Tabrizicola sp.]
MMNASQMKFGTAQPLKRREDVRFLTGQGRYVADLVPAGALHAVFLRSDHPHGEIAALDLSAARGVPGVHLVLASADLEAMGVTLGMKGDQIDTRGGGLGAAPERPVLARGRVRFVGEAIAVVVADTLAAARDAIDLIDIEINAHEVALHLKPEEPTIHPEAPQNLAFDYVIGDEAGVAAAFAKSAHVLEVEVVHNRVTAAPMEPRAAFAEWTEGRLHLCVNGQGVWTQRNELSRMLNLPRAQVRVTNPDVGGGFGMKAMTYPEYVVIAAAARALQRPVAWVSTRAEAMLTDNAGRDLVAKAEIGFDAGHRITGYRVTLVSNLGAYNSQFGQAIQTELFSKVLTGIYDVPVASLAAIGVYTNSVPIDAYRGAGRPEAILTIERVMDEAARQLGVDPVTLRQKNAIRSFPYVTMADESIDGGDFAGLLDAAVTQADVAGYAARAAASKAKGRLRGLGLASYIEAILGDSHEIARLVLDEDGGATLYVGTQSNGQGHESVFSRMVAEATGIDQSMVRIVEGDSDRIAKGGGTGGSRSVTVQGTATRATVLSMVAGFEAFLAEEWGVDAVSFDDLRFGAPGTNLRLTLAEAAALARTKGRADLIDRSERIQLDGRSFPNGVHITEVEIDPETGGLTVERYSVMDDFGVLVAPNLVEGQVHGGIAQGFGQAVTEWLVQDEAGQVVTGSFMDYGMPRADDLPMIRFAERGIPTRTNPLGMKGCGEAGTVGALAAISNAVRDALAPVGVTEVAMPFTPSRIWTWINEARA